MERQGGNFWTIFKVVNFGGLCNSPKFILYIISTCLIYDIFVGGLIVFSLGNHFLKYDLVYYIIL